LSPPYQFFLVTPLGVRSPIRRPPATTVVLSTTTNTGYLMATERLGGQIDGFYEALGNVRNLLEGKKMRPILLFCTKRVPKTSTWKNGSWPVTKQITCSLKT